MNPHLPSWTWEGLKCLFLSFSAQEVEGGERSPSLSSSSNSRGVGRWQQMCGCGTPGQRREHTCTFLGFLPGRLDECTAQEAVKSIVFTVNVCFQEDLRLHHFLLRPAGSWTSSEAGPQASFHSWTGSVNASSWHNRDRCTCRCGWINLRTLENSFN